MGDAVALVLTHPFDPTADYVVSELNRRGAPVFRCDPGEFPQRLTIAARLQAAGAGAGWVGSLHLPERRVSLTDIGCVYYRRPTGFDLPKEMSEQVRRWSAAEARMGAGGVLAALPRWLNHPVDIGRAEYKPVQLAQARACGLHVPATLVTNDPAEVRAFVAEVGRAVYKPFNPTGITEQDTHRVIFTTPITATDVDESIRLTAHLFQAWVDKEYEVRLTVVDDTFLAARIDTSSETASVDWRADHDGLTHTPLPEVPAAVRDGVRALMARLRLRFGTFDFIVSPDGRWWFPGGQPERAVGLDRGRHWATHRRRHRRRANPGGHVSTEQLRAKMVEQMLAAGTLRTGPWIAAFTQVPRHVFLPGSSARAATCPAGRRSAKQTRAPGS